MNRSVYQTARQRVERKLAVVAAAALALLSLTPLLSAGTAQAVGFTTRSMSLSNNTNSSGVATTSYSFSVVVPTGGSTGLRGVEINFCTTALYGSCTGPTGMSVTSATIGTTSPASGGTLTSSNAGTANTGLASSNSGTRQVRFQWGSDQTLTLPATVTFAINNIQNPTTAGTFYARIGFFGNGDTTYTTVTDKGVVANSVQATQNVTFKVQETLAFCVGAMPNATVAHGGFAAASLTVDCAQSAGTNIALGIAPDATTGCVTPVSVRSATCEDPSTTDDDNYGYAMVRTNAAGGVSVGYRPNSSTNFTQGTLQVSGTTGCTFTVRSDACINPVNEDQSQAAGNAVAFPSASSNEVFGMAVPAKNNTGRATNVLSRNSSATGYGYTGNLTGSACSAGTSTTDCWNWHRTGAATLASSTSAVDNEAIEVFFATKAAITTPSGQYSVDIDYFSVPTY
jgi:hypothetical protein